MIVSTQVTSVVPELAWRPPVLESPTNVILSPNTACPSLDPARDYVVHLPLTPYLRGLNLLGGRNVVVVGGEIRVPQGTTRALYVNGNRGTTYVEGLRIAGPYTQDAVCIDSRYGGSIVLQNMAVEEIHGSQDGYHADLIQTWAGPARLCVDHFYGRSDYQGFFLYPGQQWSGWTGTEVDLRHVHLDVSEGFYGLYAGQAFPVQCHEVYVETQVPQRADERDWRLWPKGDPRWAGVRLERPATPMVDTSVGLGYVSVWA